MRGPSSEFWRNKRVLVTGHTGFKGTWCVALLKQLSADVCGLALAPPKGSDSLYSLTRYLDSANDYENDIRDQERTKEAVRTIAPDIVIHMAAQSLVRESYREPLATFETNVLGTANVLQAAQETPGTKTCLVVTSDKVYQNLDTGRAFRETDPLGGDDPYSASKAACEIVTSSWRKSFGGANLRVATARAGNVIGGGDFSKDRLVPDLWRAHQAKRPLRVRNPLSTRPWQHVLDCLNGYLLFVEQIALCPGDDYPTTLNFGPSEVDQLTVGELATKLGNAIGGGQALWEPDPVTGPAEKRQLAIDSSKSRSILGWSEAFGQDELITETANWYKALAQGADIMSYTEHRASAFLEGLGGEVR